MNGLLRKCSESSGNTGSESSYFAVSKMMNSQIRVQRLLAAVGASVLLFCVAISVSAQQTNPNRLPPCPKPDLSKKIDLERSEKWTNCWGRYQIELDQTHRGDVYDGEWRGGMPNGHGSYTHANGERYVGEFKDGNRHGQGTFTFANGKRFEGIWENNNFIREAKVNLPGQNVQSTRTTQDSNTSDTSANSFGVEDAKVKCLELGFKTGTERYGKCVLELSR